MTANTDINNGQSRLVTIREAALILDRSERTIHRMISNGKLGTVELNGKTHVQLAGNDSVDSVTDSDENNVTVTANAETGVSKSVSSVSSGHDPVIEILQSEVNFLRSELAAMRSTLDRALLMLPAMNKIPEDLDQPAQPNKQDKVQQFPVWVLVAILITALLVGGIVWMVK